MKQSSYLILIFSLLYIFNLSAQTSSSGYEYSNNFIDYDYVIGNNDSTLKIVKVDTVISSNSSDQEKNIIRTIKGSAHIPTKGSIDTNKRVGEIPITSGSNKFGAKTYEVPIEVYPGMNNFQPAISLTYCSQNGNSNVGKGWSLSGISYIRRISKNLYYDGYVEGVAMDSSDCLTIDGVRLIKTSTSNTSYVIYESEIDNIKAKGHLSNGELTYFEVYYPNGEKGIFGYNDASTHEITYPLTSVTDLDGNKIEYTYFHSDNNYRIEKISYNGCSVEFSYITRNDPVLSYAGGRKIYDPYLLGKITVRYGSYAIRSYDMSYTYRSGTALLSEIGCTLDARSFNPLKFIYGEDTASGYEMYSIDLMEYYEPNNIISLKSTRARFNYELCEDGFLVYPNRHPYYYIINSSTKSSYYINQYTETSKILVYTDITEGVALPKTSLITGKGFVDILCGNLDGSPEEAIVKVNNYVESGNDYIEFSVYKSTNGGSYLSKIYTRKYKWGVAHKDAKGNLSVYPKCFYTGDFNGDGKTEIMVMSTHAPFGTDSGISTIWIIDLENDRNLYKGQFLDLGYCFLGEGNNNISNPQWVSNNCDKLLPLDYNGDGKTDICHIDDKGINIYTFYTSNGDLAVKKVGTDPVLSTKNLINQDVIVTDLNGDGLMDILRTPEKDNGTQWYVYNSLGNGTFEKHAFLGPSYDTDHYGGFMIQDVSGDGIPDLIKYNDCSFSTHIAKNNSYFINADASIDKTNQFLVPVNINSHNTATQLIGITNGIATKYSYCDDLRSTTLLRGMINSLGVVEINEYGLLSESSYAESLYTKGYASVFPYVDVLDPIPVLQTSKVYLEGNLTDCYNYSYEEAVYHRQGLGFCGFKVINRNTPRNDYLTQLFDPYNYSILKNERTPEYENIFNYNISIAQNKAVTVIPVSRTDKHILNGITATTTFECDRYGHPTKEITKYSDNTIVEQTYTYSSQTNIEEGYYYIGYQTGSEKKVTRNGTSVSEKTYSPAVSRGKTYAEIKYINGNRKCLLEYNYDSHGNLISETYSPYTSGIKHKTTYTFDSYGRLSSKTDPYGLTDNYTFDYRGRKYTHKDPRGSLTKYTYNLTGKEFTIINPDSTINCTQYFWDSSVPNSVYRITEICDGQPDVSKYYDGMNRLVRLSEKAFDGREKSTDYIYDQYGNLWKESLPFYGSNATLWNVYKYDQHDRQTLFTSATGSTIAYTYGYGSNTVTIKDNRKTTIKEYDVFGNLTSVSDPFGSVSYTVAPDNRLQTANAYDSAITSVTYDGLRRKSNLSDPSLGNLKYTYDSAGNIKTETNGNGETISYEYDTFNRLVKKSSNGLSISYYYNPYGEIDSINASNGTSLRYEYDNIGRITKCTENGLDGNWLRKEYTYSAGNIKSVKYASRYGTLATEQYSYSNGKLTEVTLEDGTIIFKVESENEFGHPLQIKTGSITRKYGFSPSGMPLKRESHGQSEIFQDFSYGFDEISRCLSWRSDNQRGLKEYFEYDVLNRLSHYDGNIANYDAKGNIERKSDVGEFGYSMSAKPYAITEASVDSNPYPSLTQEIEYSIFSRPSSIKEGRNSILLDYGVDFERVRMTTESNGEVINRIHYLGGCYEGFKIPKSDFFIERLYLLGDYYSAPVVLELYSSPSDKIVTDSIYQKQNMEDIQQSATSVEMTLPPPSIRPKYKTYYYILRDYLGSVTHVVDVTGKLRQELSYDAWGRLRDPETWETYTSGEEPVPFLGRGYTGHEHLDSFGLINMNARLYDPMLSRFLSPDPYVQNADWGQNLNRYSYALNNPLLYTDEDGQFFWAAVGAAAVIGGVFNVVNNWNSIASKGGWDSVWQGTKYFMVGAAAGGVSAAVGIGAAVGFGSMLGVTATSLAAASSSLTSSVIMKTSEGAVEGFMLGSLNALVDGKDWKSALQDGVEDGAYGALMSAATVGVQTFAPKSAKKYSVYYGYDKEGKVRYVGITSREPEVRFKEHLKSKNLNGTPTNRSDLDFIVINRNKYNRKEARIWEQNQINDFGLIKNGGDLFNKRNEISKHLWNHYGIKY